jgi:hypothetical protein
VNNFGPKIETPPEPNGAPQSIEFEHQTRGNGISVTTTYAVAATAMPARPQRIRVLGMR